MNIGKKQGLVMRHFTAENITHWAVPQGRKTNLFGAEGLADFRQQQTSYSKPKSLFSDRLRNKK